MINKLSTDSYKGVRDFYPEEMAVQRYIFSVWAQTAESFGFQRYEASVLEPSELYKAKGAANEEMVNEQTYTFTDRGEREVTLRPEMTPTVARMIAAKAKELAFPVRWYSIPNLFRYERPQKGRLREHWQLNCDTFGTTDHTADIEMIAMAHQMLLNFGAQSDMFEIRVNDRSQMAALYTDMGITDPETHTALTRLTDRFDKISEAEYRNDLSQLGLDETQADQVYCLVSGTTNDTNAVVEGLTELGITNVRIDRSIARGFDYYTGTVFEVFDVSGENNRAMLGGGRYDNLTDMFGGESIPGIGFGMGDVTMRDFLETHDLLTSDITAPELVIIPAETNYNLEGQKIAQAFRAAGLNVSVDIGTKKIGKKLSSAADSFVQYALVLGEDEIKSEQYILKDLVEGVTTTGSFQELVSQLTS